MCFTCVNCQKLHLAAKFFLNKSLLCFGHCRNSVAFFIAKPIKQVVFNNCLRFWNPQSLHSNNQNTLPPLQPNNIFLAPIFWVVMWQAATRVSLPMTEGGSGERAWEQDWYAFSQSEKRYKRQPKMGETYLTRTVWTRINKNTKYWNSIKMQINCRVLQI